MISKIQALGVALTAALAIGAMLASAAQAEPEITGFETEGTKHKHVQTTYTGTSDPETFDTFSTGAGTVECHGHYEGPSITGQERELTLYATYSYPGNTFKLDCRMRFGEDVTFTTDVSMNSCHYGLFPSTKIKTDEYTGTVDVICATPGDAIDIKITKSAEKNCTIKIPAQKGLKHVIFHNNTDETPTDVTITMTVEGAKYTTEGGLLVCGIANGEHNDGRFESTMTLEALNKNGAQIDTEVSGE
jgi:hypothetical protein